MFGSIRSTTAITVFVNFHWAIDLLIELALRALGRAMARGLTVVADCDLLKWFIDCEAA
jgi:hypothetical protein